VNLVTEVDHACERLIVNGIHAVRHGDAIVAEESSRGRPGAGPCWYVDPLDGTTNFVHGFPHCSVSIAFFDGQQMQAAVVHDPCKSETFEAARGHGAWLNGRALRVSQTACLSDALLVTEVYAAGEEPIANADGRAICRAVRGRGRLEPVFVEDVRELPAALAAVIADRDVVLTMGAGSIGAIAHELPARLGVTSARAGR
jgi:fructose-1,6-bisphosphatase/inositol monophosphatase family enzyme